MLKRRLADEQYEIPAKQLKAFEKNILRQLSVIRRQAGEHFGNAFAVNGIFNRIMDLRNARFGEMLDQKREVTAAMLQTIEIETDLPTTGKEERD